MIQNNHYTTHNKRNYMDDLIEEIIESSDINNARITTSEVKNFIPIFLNIATQDDYISSVLDNIPNDFSQLEEELNTDTNNSEPNQDDYELSKQLGPDITETKHSKIIRLLKNLLKKVVQVLIIVKAQDNERQQEYFSWQSYVKNRDLNIKEGQQYNMTIKPNQYGISLGIPKKQETLLEIDLSKNEINLLLQAQKNKNTKREVLEEIKISAEPIKKTETIVTTTNTSIPKEVEKEISTTGNYIKSSAHNINNTPHTTQSSHHFRNIVTSHGNQKLWTDWRETGRKQEGDTLTISLQSEYSSKGVHQSVPSLPSFR